jgi:hypothetical protein
MIDKIPSQESLHAVGNVRAYMKCANLCAEAKENPAPIVYPLTLLTFVSPILTLEEEEELAFFYG